MMSERAHGRQCRALLSSAWSTGRDEETSILAPVAAGRPDAAGLVPERLPLSWEVTITGWNTEEDGIELHCSWS